MRYNSNSKLILQIILALAILGASSSQAVMRAEAEGGGLKVYDPNNEKYWFKLNGQLKLDETIFTGRAKDKQNNFPSGANLRTTELSLSGGVGQHVSYTLTLGFDGKDTEISDAYVKYSGFTKNSNLYIGQVPVPYSFENTTSSKWISFLERSLPTVAFAPSYGLGMMGNAWGELFAITVAVTEPKQGTHHPSIKSRRDPWGAATRIVFSPIHTEDDGCHEAYHFSISARYQDARDTINGIRFRTRPEARARETTQILDTNFIQGKSYTVYGGEIAGIWGPLTLQGEYGEAHVQRNKFLGNPRFHGWYVQASYILTGESRVYHFHSGTLGRIKPKSDCGAWEVAIRQSYLNLNSKNIRGGKGHDTGLSLGWYANNNVRIFGNYIWSHLKPSDGTKRKLNILAMRFQVVF